MKALGERSISSFIRLVLDATWWLVATGVAFLTVLLIVSFCVNLQGDKLTMGIPVAVELDTPFHSSHAPTQTDARIEKLRGNLRFPVRNGAFLSGGVFLMLVLSALLLWVVAQLRHVFRSLSQGLLFIPENAQRIRWVGYAVILSELIRVALGFYGSYYTSQHFTANGLRFVSSVDVNGMTIIGGLAILVIAEVFREGTRLREEQSLTI